MEEDPILGPQEALINLIKSTADYLESLPEGAHQIIADLQDIQDLLNELQFLYKLECLELEKKYHELRKPLFGRLQDLVSGHLKPSARVSESESDTTIEKFWPRTLNHHPAFHNLIAEHDGDALDHLVNIQVEYLTDASSPSGLGYKLSFEFSPNEFFKDRILYKTYNYANLTGYSGDFVHYSASGTDIHWKNGIDFTKRPNGSRRASFFEFFYPPAFPTEDQLVEMEYIEPEDPAEIWDRIEADYCLGADLKDQIIPGAVSWFTGRALQQYSSLDVYEPTETGFIDPKISRLLVWVLEREVLSRTTPGFTSDEIKSVSPLFLAAEGGHVGIVKLLLRYEATDVNWRDSRDRTPLYIAAREGHADVVKALLSHNGIQVNSRSNQGWTPLSAAATRSHEPIVNMLIAQEAIDLNLKSSNGWTALAYAACYGHESIVKMLVTRVGVDLNAQTDDGWTALYAAAYYAHDTVVKVLVARDGIKLNSQTENGRTPLSAAASHGHEDVVKVLIAHGGMELNSRCSKGRTPLYYAASNGHDAVVKMLIAQNGIELNAKSNDGWTPLYAATSKGHEAVVKLLATHDGVDPIPANKAWATLSTTALVKKWL